MYASKSDATGLSAYNALRDTIVNDFIIADTTEVSNITEWPRSAFPHHCRLVLLCSLPFFTYNLLVLDKASLQGYKGIVVNIN